MTIEAIVFDIGGILELTPPTGWWQKWEGNLGLEAGELRKRPFAIWRGGSIGTLSEGDVYEQLSNVLGVDAETIERMMVDMWQEYLGTPNEELIDYFCMLGQSYRTAILSNSFVGAREREQARYGFADMCEFIVYSHEVGLQKPDPRIYQLTCDRLGLPPEAVLFVDDAEVNVLAARECGLTAVYFQNNLQTITDIQRHLSEVAK